LIKKGILEVEMIDDGVGKSVDNDTITSWYNN